MARTPITWKNIDAPNYTGAAYIQDLAARRLDNVFDSARGVVDVFGEHEKVVQDRNTQDFKNRLQQQFNSPEALRVAQANGGIDTLRQRYTENGGLNPETSGADAISALIDAGQNRLNVQQDQDMQIAAHDSTMLTNEQNRTENAGNYLSKQASDAMKMKQSKLDYGQDAQRFNEATAANKLALASDQETKQLALLKANKNVSGMQALLDSGKSVNPQLLVAAINTTRSDAKNAALGVNVAQQNLEGARAIINTMPVSERADALKAVAGEQSILTGTAYEQEYAEAMTSQSSAALQAVKTKYPTKWQEATGGPQIKAFKEEENITDLVKHVYAAEDVERGSAIDQLVTQSDVGKDIKGEGGDIIKGVDVREAAKKGKYWNEMDAGQIIRYRGYLAATDENWNSQDRKSNDQWQRELQDRLVNGPDKMSPEKAREMSEKVMDRVTSAISTSRTATAEREKFDANLRKSYDNNSLVIGSYTNLNEVGLQELLGENYGKVKNLSGPDKKAADEVIGWIRQGFVPEGLVEGRVGKFPLNEEIVKLAFNTTEEGVSWFNIGSRNSKDRFIDFIKSGIYNEQELKEYDEYQDILTQHDRESAVMDDPEFGVVPKGPNEEEFAKQKALFQKSANPEQSVESNTTVTQLPTTQITNNVQGPGEQIRQAAELVAKDMQAAQQSSGMSTPQFKAQMKDTIANRKLIRNELAEARRIAPQNVPALEAQLEQNKQLTDYYAQEELMRDEIDQLKESIERMIGRFADSNDSLGKAAIVQYQQAYVEALNRLKAHQAQLQGN